jgi:hypothetical protein
MIANMPDFFSSSQCREITSISKIKGFEKASVRSYSGSTYFNPTHRGGEVCFLKQSDLPDDLYSHIKNNTDKLNKDHFEANIETFDMQVARYNAGEQGFGWHSDDPLYPDGDSIWSGRKLTLTIELSESQYYEGGLLEIDPTLKRYDDITPVLFNNPIQEDENTLVINVPYMIPGASVEELLELSKLYQFDKKSEGESNFVSSDYRSSKKQGSCLIFPSFYNHRVTPVTQGERYSLTIWCKGPKWR